MRKITLSIALAVLTAALVAPIGLASDHGTRSEHGKHKATGKKVFTTTMKGANEVPGPGDPDGKGHARIRLDSRHDRVCYKVSTKGIDPPNAGHIHQGARGTAGPVVVPLFTSATGDRHRRGCVATTQATIDAIRANPSGYYVNVHNDAYPNGALRGQLGKHHH